METFILLWGLGLVAFGAYVGWTFISHLSRRRDLEQHGITTQGIATRTERSTGGRNINYFASYHVDIKLPNGQTLPMDRRERINRHAYDSLGEGSLVTVVYLPDASSETAQLSAEYGEGLFFEAWVTIMQCLGGLFIMWVAVQPSYNQPRTPTCTVNIGACVLNPNATDMGDVSK